MPASPPPLALRSLLLRLVAIGLLLLAAAALFAAAAGWLGPRRLNAARMVDALQGNAGAHSGFRRNHAKGICVSGHFDGNGQGSRLSSAAFFEPRRAAVTGRFALAGGNPYAADAAVPVRSMALRLQLPDAQEWRSGMNAMPGFPVSTPQAFHEQTLAMRPDPATGKPDPQAVQAFQARHPEALAFAQRLKARPRASGFANERYDSIHAFVLVAADGSRRLARWSMEPEAAFAPLDAAAGLARDALFDALLDQLGRAPLHWKLVLTLAGPGDAGDQAAQVWPAGRERVEVGRLTLEAASSEDRGACRDIAFDPLVLPRGIEPSDDPLLSARSAAYAVSFTRRAGEPPGTPAVQARSAGAAP